MLAKSSAVPVALALIGIVAAGPDPEKPRIYFPREVTRHTYNSTSSTTQVFTTTESELPTSSDSSLSTERLLDELFSELSSKTEAASGEPIDNPTLTPAVPPTLADAPGGTGNAPPVVVPPTFVKSVAKSTSSQEITKGPPPAKSEPGPAYSSGPSSHDGVQSPSSAKFESGSTSRPDLPSSGGFEAPPSSAKSESSPSSTSDHTRHNGLDLPSDTSIVIDINGIVTPTPTTNSRSREDHPTSRPPTPSEGAQPPTEKKKLVESNGTDKEPKLSSTDLGSVTPTPPANDALSRSEELPAASSSPKDGLVAPVGNLVTNLLPASTAETASSSVNSLSGSGVIPVPTTQPRPSTSSGVVSSRSVPIPSNHDVFSRPGGTGTYTTPAPTPSTEAGVSTFTEATKLPASIGVDGSSLVPIPSNQDVFSRPGGTGIHTTPSPASSTEAGLSTSAETAKSSAFPDVNGNRLVPIPSNHDVFSRPGGTGVHTTAAPASSTEVGVSTSTDAAPRHSRTVSLPEPAANSTSNGFVPSPTSLSDSESDEASTDGILPAVTSEAGLVSSLVPVVNSLLPGPANSTVASTGSLARPVVLSTGSLPEPTTLSTGSLLEPTDLLTEPTDSSPVLVSPSVKPPTANLTTGLTSLVTSSAEDIAPETFISRNSSGYTSLETATQTTSDELVPLLSSLLTPASTALSAQTSSSLANNTSAAVLPTPTSQRLTHPSDVSNATITNTTISTDAQASATIPSSTETAVSTETTDSSVLPTIAPVTNSTSSLGSTRLSTPPALNATSTSTLEPITSSSGSATTEPLLTTSVANSTEAASKTSPYRFPHSSSLTHAASSSNAHSSHEPATTVTPVKSSPHPSSTAETTEHKAASSSSSSSSSSSPPTISQQPSTLPSSSQSPSEAPQPPPTNFPKYIAPSKPAASAPVGTRNITIALNNMVVKSGIDAISTYNIISRLLPSLISLGLASGSADKVVVFSLERCGGSDESFTFLAHTSFPDDDGLVSKLQMNLGLANSPIYTTNATELKRVIEKNLPPGQSITPTDTQAAMTLRNNLDKVHKITIEHCIIRGSGKGASNGDYPGSSGDGQNGPNPGNQSETEKLKTMGMSMGIVSAGVVYGAVMFIIARRYKRKKQTHRRSSSVSNSQNSSEMRYTGGASPALMGGALPSRDYFSYRPEGRDSHGSGRSGMGNSGRTANISAPVAAENSLGWN
ncbi:hypothetical protein CP532_4071 [Ophiocordyceps camponoti-leonardi (nom. inval.)]|nr:hypothetical protein CP532_4071 [Ophiocordyceps camponoti-leonardi (nom. inval.)]